MKYSVRLFFGLGLLSLATAVAKEESIAIFDHRTVGVTVPEGFTLTQEIDQNGARVVRLANAAGSVDFEATFLPDADGDLASSARARKEMMVESFQSFVAESSEQTMQFEELDPRSGAGTYCVFTDAKLVGAEKLPPGEFRRVTVGLKAWRGGYAMFKLFSNDVTSADYLAALKLLRESLEEKSTGPALAH
jgi:hypothetical protein